MQTHIRHVHDGESTYLCDKCDAGYTNPSNLAAHVRAVHTKVKDHKVGSVPE